MKYSVRYDPKAEKQLEKLSKEIAARIVKTLRRVAETSKGIETVTNKPYGFKIRIGNYRILVDLSYNPNTIWVRYIDHRGKIYKRK
jgi:mRNA interferase RelE/StbE